MDYDICRRCGDCFPLRLDSCHGGIVFGLKSKGAVLACNDKDGAELVTVGMLLCRCSKRNVFFGRALFNQFHIDDRCARNCRCYAEQMVYEMNRRFRFNDFLMLFYSSVYEMDYSVAGISFFILRIFSLVATVAAICLISLLR